RRGYSLRSRLQCRCWATALMNSGATPLMSPPFPTTTPAAASFWRGCALRASRRIEWRRASTCGPDGLAVLVGLSHDLHRARLGHQGGRALVPARHEYRVEEDRAGGEKAPVHRDVVALRRAQGAEARRDDLGLRAGRPESALHAREGSAVDTVGGEDGDLARLHTFLDGVGHAQGR